MATIVNTPQQPAENSNNTLLVVVILAILFIVFIFYGLPRFRGTTENAPPQNAPQENAPAPQGDTNSGSEINVDIPDQIDINTNPEPEQ